MTYEEIALTADGLDQEVNDGEISQEEADRIINQDDVLEWDIIREE